MYLIEQILRDRKHPDEHEIQEMITKINSLVKY